MKMEEQKIDKRTKEYKSAINLTEGHKTIQQIKESGIPLRKVVLSYAVLFSGSRETAQQEFHDPSTGTRKEKVAKVWYTPTTIIIEKNNEIKVLPSSAVKDSLVL